MSANLSACTPRIAIWAALLSVLFAACFSIVALAANFTMLIPAIGVNPLGFAPFAPFAPFVLLAWSYLVLMACVLDAAPPEHPFPTMALALAKELRRVAAAASDDGRLRLQPRDPPEPELQRQTVQPTPVSAR